MNPLIEQSEIVAEMVDYGLIRRGLNRDAAYRAKDSRSAKEGTLMKQLSHTNIPYAVKDGRRGYLWPLVTGCAHGPDVCATSRTCWARTGAHRNLPNMKQHYNPGFSPRVNVDLRCAPEHLKRPALILVAFTGELFGDWVPPEMQFRAVLEAGALPQHTFVFLTKAPQNMVRFNPWSPNCYPGTSITGAEPWRVQVARYNALLRVEAKHRWLSYEPALGPLVLSLFPGLSWLVIGAQSGKGAVRPDPIWVADAEATATEAGIAVYRKPKLSQALGLAPREELPW